MENLRELFQVMTRRFGLLNKNCCNVLSCDLTMVHSHILYEIDRQKNASIQQIADTLGVDITTFSRQVQSLVNKNLVKKTPLPEDKRVYILSLTTEGKFITTTMDKQVNDYLNEIFSHMSEAEKSMVIRSIQILNESMGKSTMCCTPIG